jgi:hypothetical protein
MKTNRVICLKDFTIGFVLALAEKEILVIDKPQHVLHAAIESAYEAIREDVEEERRRLRCSVPLSETIGDSYDPAEIVDYALGARLMTYEPQEETWGIVRNERFTQAYFNYKPTCSALYGKAAQAFIDHPEQ